MQDIRVHLYCDFDLRCVGLICNLQYNIRKINLT